MINMAKWPAGDWCSSCISCGGGRISIICIGWNTRSGDGRQVVLRRRV